jgi:hypothetical protein
MLAHRTATTVLAGSPVVSSSALVPGTADGMGAAGMEDGAVVGDLDGAVAGDLDSVLAMATGAHMVIVAALPAHRSVAASMAAASPEVVSAAAWAAAASTVAAADVDN